MKTKRRDATMLARLNRAGELPPFWVPDTDHEAMRDLIQLRSVVRQVVTRARQHLQGFLLRHGHDHERGTAWRMAYPRWLSTLAFEHPAQQIAFQDNVDAAGSGTAPAAGRRTDTQPAPGIEPAPAMVLVAEVGDFHTLLQSTPAHGLFRPGPWRAIEWRDRLARRHYQDRQHPRPARAGPGAWAYRMRPLIGRRKFGFAPDAAAERARQERERRQRRHRTRDGRLHLVDGLQVQSAPKAA